MASLLSISGHAARCFIACLLAATALGKALDVGGFVAVIDTYQTLPSVLHWPAAVSMILVEAALALWLTSGRHLPLAAMASAALHTTFLLFAGQALARGLAIDNCGCFGVFLARPLTLTTLFEDGFMVALSLCPLWCRAQMPGTTSVVFGSWTRTATSPSVSL